jgi:hypothetical protein
VQRIGELTCAGRVFPITTTSTTARLFHQLWGKPGQYWWIRGADRVKRFVRKARKTFGPFYLSTRRRRAGASVAAANTSWE